MKQNLLKKGLFALLTTLSLNSFAQITYDFPVIGGTDIWTEGRKTKDDTETANKVYYDATAEALVVIPTASSFDVYTNAACI